MNEPIDPATHTELEAAAFRRLVAGFCRNCLAKWYKAAAEDKGLDVDYDQAREHIYGMPYNEWKEKYQK